MLGKRISFGLLLFLIALSFFLMNLVGLTRSPVVWLDEVTLNDPAKELAESGILRSSVFAGERGFERAYFWQPPLQPFITAISYRFFGFGIWQTRIPPLIFGGGVVFLIGLITFKLFGSRLGALFSSLIFALEPKFIQTARSGRMDAQCLFFALLGLYFYLRFREERRHSFLALSGLMVGLAIITHPVAFSWAIGIGVLVLFSTGEGRLKSSLYFAISAAIPPLLWVGYGLYFFPRLFFDQFILHGEGHLVTGGLLSRLIAELHRYLRAYHLVPLLLLSYIIAVFFLLLKFNDKNRFYRLLLVLFAILFFFNAFLMVKTVGHYYLHPVSILVIALGMCLSALVSASEDASRRRGRLVFLFLLLLFGNIVAGGIGGRYLALAYQWCARDYRHQVVEPLKGVIPPGSIVWGRPEVWYALEKGGAELRLLGEPDPKRHHFAVVKPGGAEEKLIESKGGFTKIKEIGKPLPPILGRITLPSGDYRLAVWRSDYLFPSSRY